MKKFKNWLLNKIQNEQSGGLGYLVLSFLYGLSLVYRSAVRCRNWAYDRKIFATQTVDANVISVGNLTTGGTGKTPFVIWLANQISAHYPTAIVSRGYRAENHQLNDEGMEISMRTNQIVQVQNSDRIAASKKAIQQLGPSELQHQIILDDGFQHRRLLRNFDIVLIDATDPFGGNHLLPRGLLREEISGLKRAHFVVLTRANLIPVEERQSIKKTVESIQANLGWAESYLRPSGWLSLNGQVLDLEQLKNKPLLAFSGIGNPAAFHNTVQSAGFTVSRFDTFDDHHHFTAQDIIELNSNRLNRNCQAMVCTVKDMVKITKLGVRDIPIFAFMTELEFICGQQELIKSTGLTLSELKNAG